MSRSIKKAYLRFLHSRAKRARGADYARQLTRIMQMNDRRCRCTWTGTHYTLYDEARPQRTISFRHEEQGLLAYRQGLENRAKSLSAAYLLHHVTFSNGDLILDCGANVGDFRLCLDEIDVDIRYHAFEPSPVEFRCLQKNLEGRGSAHNVGLWSADDELTFFVSSQGADSSLVEPAEFDERIKVKTERIWHYLGEPVKLLKLEAEGAEPEILEGAGERLENITYISADLGFERGLRAESTFAPVANHLFAHGFEMIAVSRPRLCALFVNASHRHA
ncbi:FkbM family methyltransferase [Rhodobacterales bacterium HKCCE3408]|nr:FkbM family methyltransferase [Rhodobacterales bacterium HKCCE3408]